MPSASLDARVLLLFQQVGVTHPNISPLVFTQFKELLEQSEGLIGFPLKKTIQLIGQVGELVPASPEYDQLNEAIAIIIEKHEGETGRAGQLVNRAHQKLEHGHDYDAIELAGRGLELLWKNEDANETRPRPLYPSHCLQADRPPLGCEGRSAECGCGHGQQLAP